MQARVAAALEHLDAPAALGEQGGEQGTGEAGAADGEGFGISVFQICPHTPFVHNQVLVRWEATALGCRFRGIAGFWESGWEEGWIGKECVGVCRNWWSAED